MDLVDPGTPMSTIKLFKSVPREVKGAILAASKAMSPPQPFEDWAISVLSSASRVATHEGFSVRKSEGRVYLCCKDQEIEVRADQDEAARFATHINTLVSEAGR